MLPPRNSWQPLHLAATRHIVDLVIPCENAGTRRASVLAWRRLDRRSITCSNFILREDGWPPRVEHDRHICGLFPRAGWIRLLREAGFRPEITRDQYERDVFVARRPTR
jgi:hypothetical protein